MAERSPSDPARTGVFDARLASRYDGTRAISAAAMRQLVAMLRSELVGWGPCLEIGVGTGRIALPLQEAGVEMAGLDASEPMLAKLLDKGGGRPPFRLVRGDARALPFAGGAFGSALLCHVLHLLSGWETALDELARVVDRPGLVLLELATAREGGPAAEVRARFHQEAGVERHVALGVRDAAAVDGKLVRLGARGRDLPEVREAREVSIAETIRRLELGIHSSNAALAADTRQRAAEATRRWAERRFGDLDVPARRQRLHRWRAYDL